MITNLLVAIIVISIVIILLYDYIQKAHTKARPATNPWDMASLPHRNRKATFFQRVGGVTTVKESANEKVHKLPNRSRMLTKRNRTINTLTKN